MPATASATLAFFPEKILCKNPVPVFKVVVNPLDQRFLLGTCIAFAHANWFGVQRETSEQPKGSNALFSALYQPLHG